MVSKILGSRVGMVDRFMMGMGVGVVGGAMMCGGVMAAGAGDPLSVDTMEKVEWVVLESFRMSGRTRRSRV